MDKQIIPENATAPPEQPAAGKMTDADATRLDWWLLDYLREQLFNPPADPGPSAPKVRSTENSKMQSYV